MAATSIVTPGQILAPLSTHVAGPGTHIYEDNILASLTGSTTTERGPSKKDKPTISVVLPTTGLPLPAVNSIILGRVIRVQSRQLIVTILPVAPSSSTSSLTSYPSFTNDDLQYQAILRREDIRAFEKDKIEINEMYRVGDIIRAVVVSLGDERSYYISTAGNEFGVVVARSESGNAMAPSSWREMRDVVTGRAEGRKVAKPV